MFLGKGVAPNNAPDDDGNGKDNTITGGWAGNAATKLRNTSLYGSVAGVNLRDAKRITAIGNGALSESESPDDDVAIGYRALVKDETSANLAAGNEALENTDAPDNVGLGLQAGKYNEDGQQDLFLGRGAGVTTNPANASVHSSNITCVGTYSGSEDATQHSNSGAFGHSAHFNASNQVALGNNQVVDIYLGGKRHLFLGGTSDPGGAAGSLWFHADGSLYQKSVASAWVKFATTAGDFTSVAVRGGYIRGYDSGGNERWNISSDGSVWVHGDITADGSVSCYGLAVHGKSAGPLKLGSGGVADTGAINLANSAEITGLLPQANVQFLTMSLTGIGDSLLNMANDIAKLQGADANIWAAVNTLNNTTIPAIADRLDAIETWIANHTQ